MNSRRRLRRSPTARLPRARARRGTGGGGGEARRARGAAAAAELRRPRRRRRGGGGGGGARITRASDDDASDVPRVRGLGGHAGTAPGVGEHAWRARANAIGGGDLACAGNARAGSNGAGNPGSASLVSGRDDPPSAGAAGLVSSRSAGATSLPSAPRRSTPSIKQRLAEALTPTRAPGELGAWRFNARVTGLNLSNASIGLEGAAFLAEALRPRRNGDGSYSHNGSLRSLNLEFNNLRCEGVALIAEALAPLWVPPAGGDLRRGVEGPATSDRRRLPRPLGGQRLARAPQPQLLRSRRARRGGARGGARAQANVRHGRGVL